MLDRVVLNKLLSWVELGSRLLHAGPHRWDDVVQYVTAIVEAQETLNKVDRSPTIDGSRPRSRFLS